MRELTFVVEEKRGAVQTVMLWIARVVLAMAFVAIGFSKFSGNPNGEWVKVFERIAWGQWFRVFTGVVQVTGGLFLLTRWTLTAGAVLLAGTMAGAMIVHVFVMRSPVFAIIPFALLGMIGAVWFSSRFGSDT